MSDHLSDETTGTADDGLSRGFVNAAKKVLSKRVVRPYLLEAEHQPDPEALVLLVTCPLCGSVTEMTVPRREFERWRDGGGLTNTLGMLPLEQREQLVSGIDTACWNRLCSSGEEGARRIVGLLLEGIKRRSGAFGS